MTSLTRTAHGPASGLRQGRSRACDVYQRRIAATCPFIMTTESCHSRGTPRTGRHLLRAAGEPPTVSDKSIAQSINGPETGLSSHLLAPPGGRLCWWHDGAHPAHLGGKRGGEQRTWWWTGHRPGIA